MTASRGSSQRAPRHATYVFCILESARPPGVDQAPPGPEGLGELRALPIAPALWAVVADAPHRRFSEAGIRELLESIDEVTRAALAHEAVVRFFFRRRAVIPLKMLTLFGSDARAREDLGARADGLRTTLRALVDRQEWAVSLDPIPQLAGAQAGAAKSGRDYLRRKTRALASRRPDRGLVESRVLRVLKPGTVASRRQERAAGEGGAAISLAFLVDRGALPPWQARAARLRETLVREGWQLRVTGPWPPYNFIPHA